MIDAQLAVRIGDMTLDGREADHQLIGDLLVSHSCSNEAQDLEFAGGQWLRQASYGEACGRRYGLGSLLERRQQSSDIGARDAPGHRMAQQVTHWWPFVHEDPHVAFRLGKGKCPCQVYETSGDG